MGGLQKAREDKGWSRKELAGKIGVSEATIFRYESGDRPMTDARVSQLAAALGVNPVIIKPDFGKAVIAGLNDKSRQIFFDHLGLLFGSQEKGS